jgi:hypothetical protein
MLHTPDPFAEFRIKAEPKMSAAEDVARTLPGAVARGVNQFVGTLGDLNNLGQRGFNWAADHAVGALQDFTGSDLGLPHHPQTPTEDQDVLSGNLTSGDLNAATQGLFGAYHLPQTWEGRTADTFGQLAPLALAPGSALARFTRVALPTATSEAAGEAFRDPNNPGGTSEEVARVVGALGGGYLDGFGRTLANGPQIATSKFLQGYTPSQVSDAIDFQTRMASEHGLTLTPLEALTQRSGGAANQLQHYVENSYTGRPQVAPFFDARRGQVKTAAQWLADFISPEQGQTPGMLGLAAQREAQGAMTKGLQARTAYAQPDYAAADAQTVPPEDVLALRNGIMTQAASDKTGLLAPTLRDMADRLVSADGQPITDVANLDRVRKYYRDQIGLRTVGQDALTSEQSGAIGAHVGALDKMLEQVPEFAAAKAKFQDFTGAVVDPMQAGPIGRIAQTPDLSSQTAALYPARPNVGGTSELTRSLTMLPDTGAPLTRQHLLDTADAALADLQGGENQWAGSKYAKAIAGTDEQRARLDAGVRTVAGDVVADRLADMLEGFRATGKRMPTGSQTQFNAERAAALGVTPLPARILGGALDPLEIGQHLNRALGGALYRRNIGVLSDLLTRMGPAEAKAFLDDALARGAAGETSTLTSALAAPRSAPGRTQ